MEKTVLFVIMSVLFSSGNQAYAQVGSTITDTLAYVQHVISNKQSYVGKSFSVLKKDLKLPIKSCTGFPKGYANVEGATVFYFRKKVDSPQVVIPENGLLIYWRPPFNDLILQMSFSDFGEWNGQLDSLYSSGKYIIDDIDVL